MGLKMKGKEGDIDLQKDKEYCKNMKVVRVPKKPVNLIRAYAPVRVDFVGGTLDIWPIGVMIGGALTVNCAINLFARVEARKIKEKTIRIISEDYGIEYDLKKGKPPQKISLILELIKHYEVYEGWEILIRSDFPTGSGLGGSSAISVALSKLLLKIKEKEEEEEKSVLTLKDLESRNLKIPTGVQDFWPAILGGLMAIHYKIGKDDVESLGQPFPFLKERVVVAYSGKSRISSETNYKVYRSFLDGEKKVVQSMENIAKASREFYFALKNCDFESAGEAMLTEWHNRKKLSPLISTPKMEELESEALKAGAIGVKGCGAGGGGSMVFLVKPSSKRNVEIALTKCGATILNCEPINSGYKVEVEQ